MKVASWVLPRPTLLVLSHMRSYSSLLCHVLGSHAQIDGYCEAHVKYRRSLDLLRLRRRVQRLTGEPLQGRYVLDKILHDYPLAASILRRTDTRAIFIVRRPQATLASIMEMGQRYIDRGWYQDLTQVTAYYEARLAQLAEIALALPGRAAFFESEALLTRSEEVLAFLADFLKLESPLDARYRRFAHTGEPGFGDPSASIRSGRIEAGNAERAEQSLPPSIAAELDKAYQSACAALKDRCQTLV